MRLIKFLILFLIFLTPFKLFADSDYKEHCAACHGEHAEGSFGPALSGAINKDEFRKIIRSGKGMMPAIEINDKEIDEIYKEIGEIAGDAASEKPFFAKISSWLLAKKNLRTVAWSTIALAFIGAILILVIRFAKWSAFSEGKKHFKLLGVDKCLKIIFTVLFGDTLSVSSVYKKKKGRWIIHGLIAYGFFGLILADILISIFNPERGAMPFLSPLKIFANICGVSLLTGLFVVIYRLFTDPFENNNVTLFGDIAFVTSLLIAVLSGFATEATRYLKFPEYTQYVYFVHILFFIVLFTTAPFTRFVHILSTFFFVLNTRLGQAVTESGAVLEFNEEPAPGRHFKSARIAKDLFGGDTKIRYFP